VDICGAKWPEHGPRTQIDKELKSSDSLLLQNFSGMERVTGIDAALSVGEEF